jgi:hypothetical protein
MSFEPGDLLASLLISSIGYVLFSYGRKQSRFPHILCGIILLVYPYFIGDLLWMLVVGAVLLALLWLAVHLGL